MNTEQSVLATLCLHTEPSVNSANSAHKISDNRRYLGYLHLQQNIKIWDIYGDTKIFGIFMVTPKYEKIVLAPSFPALSLLLEHMDTKCDISISKYYNTRHTVSDKLDTKKTVPLKISHITSYFNPINKFTTPKLWDLPALAQAYIEMATSYHQPHEHRLVGG